jgi:DNA polymerase-3 subunit epsilon
MRQIVLDTETTGLEPAQGHRIIEIGAVELVDRRLSGRHFHKYVNPERDIDDGAFEVHGLSREFLADKPVFAAVAEEFLDFIKGAEVIIHNAGFDVAFLDHELAMLPGASRKVSEFCEVTDSLAMARHKHPGQKNNLDALCRRYLVDNSSRTLHGALLDAEILADVYLLMTGGQTALFGAVEREAEEDALTDVVKLADERPALPVILPDAEESAAHEALLDFLDGESEGSVWRKLGLQ